VRQLPQMRHEFRQKFWAFFLTKWSAKIAKQDYGAEQASNLHQAIRRTRAAQALRNR
jgi:hypothetical protein